MECLMCTGQLFVADEHQLEIHLADYHFGIAPYECRDCIGKKFSTEYALREHYNHHHGRADAGTIKIDFQLTKEEVTAQERIRERMQVARIHFAQQMMPGEGDGRGGEPMAVYNGAPTVPVRTSAELKAEEIAKALCDMPSSSTAVSIPTSSRAKAEPSITDSQENSGINDALEEGGYDEENEMLDVEQESLEHDGTAQRLLQMFSLDGTAGAASDKNAKRRGADEQGQEQDPLLRTTSNRSLTACVEQGTIGGEGLELPAGSMPLSTSNPISAPISTRLRADIDAGTMARLRASFVEHELCFCNRSKLQCRQCGVHVSNTTSAKLNHLNQRHLHLPLHRCRECVETFETVGHSSATHHAKNAHGRGGKGSVEEVTANMEVLKRRLNSFFYEDFSLDL